MGRWRGLYLIGIEAWAGYPDISEAVKKGVYLKLKPEKSLECETRTMILEKEKKKVGISYD